MNKKYLIFGGLALLGVAAYAGKKGYDIYSVFSKLETKLNAVRGLSFLSHGVRMNVDIAIINPTSNALNVSTGGALKVKQIVIRDKNGTEVARATPNLQQLSIVPGGMAVLENIPVETRWGTILDSLLKAPSSNPDDYQVELVLETMTGNLITI